MAWAVCEKCGEKRRWYAGRGMKLSDLRCHCGGNLRGKTAGLTSKTKGKKYGVCELCTRHKRHITDRLWKLRVPVQECLYLERILPAGSIICGWHELNAINREDCPNSSIFWCDHGWHANMFGDKLSELEAINQK